MEHRSRSFVKVCIFWSVDHDTRTDPVPQRQVEMVAALAEPTRRRLYELITSADTALSREQVAERSGLPVHTAKFHLDKLLAEGLLEVEFHKLTGREGPGSGRPAKHYRRAEGEIALSVPPRQYDLLSRILANAVAQAAASGEPAAEVASRVAHAEGMNLGSARAGGSGGDLARVGEALRSTGYEPRPEQPGRLVLRNCPFHRTAAEQTELVCGLNFEFVTGVCAGLRADSVETALEPEPGRCCVTVSATS